MIHLIEEIEKSTKDDETIQGSAKPKKPKLCQRWAGRAKVSNSVTGAQRLDAVIGSLDGRWGPGKPD